MKVLAIDPGSEKSGYVIYDGEKHNILSHGIKLNVILTRYIKQNNGLWDELAVEYPTIQTRKMGDEVIQTSYSHILDTCYWVGRFVQANSSLSFTRINRKDIKKYLTGKTNTGDKHIRAAIIKRYLQGQNLGGGSEPAVGTSKMPGPLYGITSHATQALAVAFYHSEVTRGIPWALPRAQRVKQQN